jgi:molecular chaperone DnaK
MLTAAMKLGEAMYKAQSAGAGEGAAPGGDEKVVDADFEEVDGGKKD